jgi:SWI/SNF-related matrix-associated actin-dependent regulator of chromatin subfamily A protein 2/4
MKLPSKQELPDYYNIIKRPIDIKKIQQRLEENKVGFEMNTLLEALGLSYQFLSQTNINAELLKSSSLPYKNISDVNIVCLH